MPINKKVMREMKKEYGKKKGEDVYYGWETNQKKKHGKARSMNLR